MVPKNKNTMSIIIAWLCALVTSFHHNPPSGNYSMRLTDEMLNYQLGRPIVFDDSYEHEVRKMHAVTCRRVSAVRHSMSRSLPSSLCCYPSHFLPSADSAG